MPDGTGKLRHPAARPKDKQRSGRDHQVDLFPKSIK